MYVKQCDRCKIIIKGEYTDLRGTAWTKNGALVKDIDLHLCPKCMANFEKWLKMEDEKNGSMGNN